MNAKVVRLEDARVNLSEMIARVRYMRERFVIQKNGRRVAMVIPLDDGAPEPDKLPDHFSANLTVIDLTIDMAALPQITVANLKEIAVSNIEA